MKRNLLFVFCLLLCANLSAQQQIVQNYKGEFVKGSFAVEQISQYHVNALCTDGDYLYAAAENEIYAIDISKPLEPEVLSCVKVYGLVRQMVVQNGTLFASARESGCWIVDVSDPLNIKLITRYDPIELSTGIEVAGDVLFLGTRQNGIECVDISDVRNPVHIRMEKTGESQSVCYRDGILYSGEWGPHCVTVIDARDMAKLKTVRTVSLQGYGDGLWICGKYLYVSTGHHLVNPTLTKEECHGRGHGVEIFDLTDPWNPVFVSRVSFDRIFSHYNDYWTPRPCSDGKYVICADTVNGMYVVDSSKPESAEVITRVRFLNKEGENIAVNSVAVANGVVYVALWNTYGLMALECPEAYPNVPQKGIGPKNASYRYPYQTSRKSHFHAWKPENGAPVRGIAVKDDFAFAACSYGGLAVLKKSTRGTMAKIADGPMKYAGDVKVLDDRLYVAEGPDGLGVYEIGKDGSLKELARYEDFSLDGPMAYCLWVYVPHKDWIVASTRYNGNYYLNMKNFPNISFEAKIGDNPGWDKYPADKADSKGMYPATRSGKGIFWVNLNERPLKEVQDHGFKVTLYDGVCRLDRDRFLTVVRGKTYIYTADQMGQARTPVQDKGDEDYRGFPTWDGNSKMSLTCRVRREIRLLNTSDEENPQLIWMEKTDGFPETPTFWQGKLAVPCGYQGLLLEK